ncbi:Glycosyl hydrolase family 9 [Ruminococcus flavefaciens]|uniref:Glycosyl hydrolase family 9 n=1 Tax=Ruminococcus flavefaciens TaxID=1265 RepID=A0A1H6KW45_RUMFL|nr:glycoside hydrolase family 9 protein [Ruminococcus flavefaciens]SEH77843.1 Glycosyl hydrolase family 9 [Ruminococcus flavefaciens]
MKNLKKLSKRLTAAAASAVMALTSLGVSVPSVASAEDKDYYKALAMSLYMYDANACGKGISDGPLTWRGDCHTYDSSCAVGTLDGSAKSVVDPDGDGKVDLSGGFHDAGDHIKFNLTIGFGISSLALSDYLNPGVYEKAGCKDHLIYELKWGSDYLMKTTFLDSSGNVAAIAHVVAGGNDHDFWGPPETQTYERPAYWLTAGNNNSAVCGEMAAALAGTAYVVKESDPDYAAKCLKYAKAIYEFGKKNVGNNTSGLSPFYDTEAQYQDEEAWANAWLWINDAADKPTRVPKDANYGDNQYDGWIYCWNKVWQGYSALMYKATGEQAFADELQVELKKQGDLTVGTYNADGWGASRYNCAKQMDALILANGDPEVSYAKAAKYQMDHILGDNSLGYSFLLGYGDKWPVHIHHRAANPGTDSTGASGNPSAKYTAYGLLVGGDDKSGYQDQTDKYQYTEGALDYNGCFAIACAGIANLYGGDAASMPALAKSVSEINADFKFGNSSAVNTELVVTPDKSEYAVGDAIKIHVENVLGPTLTVSGSSSLAIDGVDTAAHTADIVGTAPNNTGDLKLVISSNGSTAQSKTITLKIVPAATTTATTTAVTTTVTTADVTLTNFDSQKFDSVDTYPTKTVYNTGDSFQPEDIKINVITRYSAVHASGKVTYIDKKETITYGVRPESVTLVNANGQEFKATEMSTIPAGKYTAKYRGGVIGTNLELYDVEFDYEITIVGNSVTTTTATTSVVTTPTTGLNGSDFELSINRDKLYIGETATLSFSKGANLIPFGNFDYDKNIISMEKNADNTFTIKALRSGDTKLTFTAPTGQSKYLWIAVQIYVDPGDANCDGQVDLADVVLIMQALANPNKYGENGSDPTHITETGMANADVDTSSEGITVNDAMVLQLYLLHSIEKIPCFYTGK